MTNVTINFVKKLVAQNNAAGKITMSYLYANEKDNHNIHFSNGVTLTFESSVIVSRVFRILKQDLYFEQDFNYQSDENDGIIQAANNGENPFAYSVICANPSLNGIFN